MSLAQLEWPSAQSYADGSRRHNTLSAQTQLPSHILAVGAASCADGKAAGTEITLFANSGSDLI
jgi:hypothetical protein